MNRTLNDNPRLLLTSIRFNYKYIKQKCKLFKWACKDIRFLVLYIVQLNSRVFEEKSDRPVDISEIWSVNRLFVK